jgi:hypothetical protein
LACSFFCSFLLNQPTLLLPSCNPLERRTSTLALSPRLITSTNGNLFIADTCYYLQGNTFTSITDSKSNSYTQAGSTVVSSGDLEGQAREYYIANGTGGATHNFTVTLSGNGFPALAAKEVSDALTSNVLDRTASKSDNSGTTGLTSSTTATTIQANELLNGLACLWPTSGTIAFTAQSGFTANVNISHVAGRRSGHFKRQ